MNAFADVACDLYAPDKSQSRPTFLAAYPVRPRSQAALSRQCRYLVEVTYSSIARSISNRGNFRIDRSLLLMLSTLFDVNVPKRGIEHWDKLHRSGPTARSHSNGSRLPAMASNLNISSLNLSFVS